MKKIEVVAAIIVHTDKILCVQRNESKYEYVSFKYEFPGGKIELDETAENALIREIKEELRMDIRIQNLFLTVEHTYPDFHITMHSYICHTERTDLQLEVHVDYKWLTIDELDKLDWAAADIPIVDKLKANFSWMD
ncbi:MAG: (deoxy)nucleoside triphosphate pyrophosphohydrolase [Fluviicola sp.]|nr:(deoxy)nucleoside triphosphate pyrophosphohydrolase [Fluviicola sp.]